MTGNPVRFIYISAGKSRPTPIDPDAIYFMESEKQIWVGDVCIADSVEPVDVASYLAPYLIKSVSVVGEGETLADAQFDETSGVLTLTKGHFPSIEKGVDEDPEQIELVPGSEFTAITDTSVSGHTIRDHKTTFKLPVQLSSISVSKDGNVLKIITTYSDENTAEHSVEFGSAAFTSSSDYATAAQGAKADAAMPAQNGTATGAHITLAEDPVQDMDAATKRYVDKSISDLGSVFTYRGESSTPITAGGRETPTIDGEPVEPTQGMKKGDVVSYQNHEFVWEGSYWREFGAEGDYALKTELEASEQAAKAYADQVGNEVKDYVDEAIDGAGIHAPEYTIVKVEDQSDTYQAVYLLSKDGSAVGDPINIPKSTIIKSSSVKTVVEPDVPYEGAVPGDKYIDFETGDGPDDHLYIPTSDIGVSYEAGQGIEIADTTISHQLIGDGSEVPFTDVDVSQENANVLVFTKHKITRDAMGHVVSSEIDSESSSFEVLSQDGVRQMILDYVPTWLVEQAQASQPDPDEDTQVEVGNG